MRRPASEFIETTLLQEHIAAAEQFVADDARRTFQASSIDYLRSVPNLAFDSPLEAVFWLWWMAVMQGNRHWDDMFLLQPQEEVTVSGQRYRLDFMLIPYDEEVATSKYWSPIAVELDGHEFHERTPDQVARRDQRDRALQAANWHVFHFSFKEFVNRPVDCISEVLVFARDRHNQAAMASYRDRRTTHASRPVPPSSDGTL
jgi:very-short-patch-repair endonuclease